MEFILEVSCTTLNFLDLTLTLTPRIQGLQVEFNIYRKPTFTRVSTHQDSHHPKSHKLVVINQGRGRSTERSEVRVVIYAPELGKAQRTPLYIRFGAWKNSGLWHIYSWALGHIEKFRVPAYL